MSTSQMNLEELITSAKSNKYAKRLTYISISGIAVCGASMLIGTYLEPTGIFKVLCAIGTVLSLFSIVIAFIRWGSDCSDEIVASKFKDMNIGQLKDLYKTYGLAPTTDKRLDEKILIEQIMIDMAMHFKNQGSFVEPFTDVEAKGLKHKSLSVYSFIAMAVNPSIDDRIKRYILDTFLSANFLDDVKLDSIKFRK